MEGQTDKQRKYDRQIRLWGEHGQRLLERASVCLLHANGLGTELLKNLVLPAVGSFTVVDNKVVTEQDLASNFFVAPEQLGQSRAAAVTELLLDLNADVRGQHVDENPIDLVERDPDFFGKFSVVVACDMTLLQARKIAAVCWSKGVCFLLVRSCGLYTHMRIAVPEHEVREQRQTNPIDDMRITSPFPQLEEFANSFDLEGDVSQCPFVVLLIRLLADFKAEHGGRIPFDTATKDAFRSQVSRLVGLDPKANNIEQAKQYIVHAFRPYSLPEEVQKLFAHERCTSLSRESTPFWVIARALKDFVENEGQGTLPVEGKIPDMDAPTSVFLDTQRIYKEKAAADRQIVVDRVRTLLKALDRSEDEISVGEINLHLDTARYMAAVHYRSVEEELAGDREHRQEISSSLTMAGFCDSVAPLYVVFRALDVFVEERGRFPGDETCTSTEADQAELKSMVIKYLQAQNVELMAEVEPQVDDIIAEFVRFGGLEMHNVAAHAGGLASLEVIKLITKILMPVNNTLLVNNITGSIVPIKV